MAAWVWLSALVAVPLVFLCALAKRAWRAHVMRTYTAVPDLAFVGKPRAGGRLQGTAVVCGGSFAGLFTAHVLASHYTRVLVLEPEQWTFTPEARAIPFPHLPHRDVPGEQTPTMRHSRSRVFQFTALHAFQVLLLRFLRRAFHNVEERAADAGIRIGPAHWGVILDGNTLLTPTHKYCGEDHETLFASRRAMESLVRALVAETGDVEGLDGVYPAHDPTIKFVCGTVTSLGLSPDNKSVRNVTYRDERGEVSDVETSLIVDCTGITQAGLKLLSRALNDASLANLRVEYNPKMYYESIVIEGPPDFDERASKLNIVHPVTHQPIDVSRTGFFYAITPHPSGEHRAILLGREEDRFVFGLGGWDSELPPTWDDAIYYARQITNPCPVPEWVFQMLDILAADGRKERITISSHRFTCASRVFYESRADVIPTNFVALGDSTMRLNPRLGEGTTKACLGAITLNALLHERTPDHRSFSKTFFQRLALRTGSLWDASKWLDYGRDTTVPCEGESLAEGRQFRALNRLLYVVFGKNEYAAETFWLGTQWLVPSTDILAPSILWAVLKVALFGK